MPRLTADWSLAWTSIQFITPQPIHFGLIRYLCSRIRKPQCTALNRVNKLLFKRRKIYEYC